MDARSSRLTSASRVKQNHTMYTTIPSILNGEKIAYKVHSHFDDLWDSFRSANRPLDVHIGVFETYGDGTTQHSGEWPANNEQFTDFCLSFAHRKPRYV